MKAVAFTIDAIFSLMIATAGIALILYFTYTAPTPAVIQYSSSSAFINEMASTKLAYIVGVPLAQMISNQSAAAGQYWPETLKDGFNSAGNGYGPSISTVAFVYNAPGQIMNGTIVAAYGNVYFGAGNVVYALNATSGNVLWTSHTPYNLSFYQYANSGHPISPPQYYTPAVNSTVIYDGMLIYATAANVVALNAYNGSVIWSIGELWGTSEHGDSSLGYNEPDQDESTSHLLIYNNKIITGTWDGGQLGSEPSGNPLYAFYANNGTVAGKSTTSYFQTGSGVQLQNQYMAFALGQIIIQSGPATFVPPFGSGQPPGTVYILTPILNSTYAAAEVNSIPFSAFGQLCVSSGLGTCPITGIATFGNVIGYGNGIYGNIYNLAGAKANYNINSGGEVTGVSSNNGHFVFQSAGPSGSVMSVPIYGTGTYNWLKNPSSALTTFSLLNATPVQSSTNVYTMWGNGEVAEENLSTGTFSQYSAIPYYTTPLNVQPPISVNPYMALAYGKLFTSVGNKLVVFGTCAADRNASILTALATMYINNEGSCADFLLNSLQNSENTTFTINNHSIITKAYFSGSTGATTSNIIIPYSSKLAVTSAFTLSMWFSTNTLSAAGCNPLISSFNPTSVGTTFELDLSLSPCGSQGIKADVGNGNLGDRSLTSAHLFPVSITQDAWYNLVTTFSKTGMTVYLNGNLLASQAWSGTPSFLGTGSSIYVGGTGAYASTPFKGSIANLQIYNTTLTQGQAGQLFRDGISGPPVSQSNIVAWFPFAGDANGYSRQQDFPGFPSNIVFNDATYNATAITNSYSITSQTEPVVLFNYTTGTYNLYTAGVYSWR